MKKVKYVLCLALLMTGLVGAQYSIGSFSAESETCPVRVCNPCRPDGCRP